MWSGGQFISQEDMPGSPELRLAQALLKLQNRTLSMTMFGSMAIGEGVVQPTETIFEWQSRGLVEIDGDTIKLHRNGLSAYVAQQKRGH